MKKHNCCILAGLLIFLLSSCGTTVEESLKVEPYAKTNIGQERNIVILPLADYSYAENLETAYRRNLFITENLTDNLVRHGFHLPVQEDVFMYLVNQNIINVAGYDQNSTRTLDYELQSGEWSGVMRARLQQYTKAAKASAGTVSESPGTHGLTQQEIVKIGRHFSADYILRGRIIQYKDRLDPSWAPWKRGVIGFVSGVSNRVLFGQADSEKYDNWGNMVAGAAYGAWLGGNVNWPLDDDHTIFGISSASSGNEIIWGILGAGAGHMAHKTGKIPQAVVQVRIWVQDAYTGHVVWTNRVDVKVSPESVLADYQYDALFEGATEKAVNTLIEDFVSTL